MAGTQNPSSPGTPHRNNTITYQHLVKVIESVLVNAGASKEVATILAQNHASCERDGSLSHGVFRIPQYVQTLQTGYLNGAPQPQTTQVAPGYFRVDADHGIAQLPLKQIRNNILEAVKKHGVAVAAIRDAHHHSALWPDIEPFAEAGYVAITTVTGGEPVVAPAGAHTPVLSTNPFAFAFPTAPGTPPIVADFATSSMSYGDLTLAARNKTPVPPGTGVNANGQDTVHAESIIEGGNLLPFGGHKGALLSILVELLASALTGSDFSFEASTRKPEHAHTTRTGQFLIVIDPDKGVNTVDSGIPGFAVRASHLVETLKQSGMGRMPADRRYQTREQAQREGIPVTEFITQLLTENPYTAGHNPVR